MAINLRKEAYQKEQSSENNAQPIREVFPTYDDTPYNRGNMGEDGEIYPVREIFPKPPPMNIVNEEETAVEAPEEKNPTAPKRKKKHKKAVVICAVTAVILAAGTIFGISARNDDTGYSCYRIKCVNILSSENVNEVIINGENASLNVEYGEVDCDIEIGTISGNQLSVNEIHQQDSDKTTLIADFTYVDIENAYCVDEPDKVTLTLPKNYNGCVQLIGSDTEISCTGCSDADGNIDFYCRNGNITIYGGTSGNVSLSTEYGSITVSDVTAKTFEASSPYGDLILNNVTSKGGVKLCSDYGNISMENTSFLGCTVIESTSGCIFGKNTVFRGNSTVSGENSYIELKKAVFGNMTVTNTNGYISISSDSSRSDYIVNAKTDNGKCNAPLGGDGQYTLDVTSLNGDIHVYFHN